MKTGLGDSYDNVSVLSKKTRAYIDLTQPASTIGLSLGVALASFFYVYYTGEAVAYDTILYVSVTVAAAHGGSQALNQAEDAEMDSDTPHKSTRPIPAGIVTEEEARTIAWILIFFAIGRGYLVSSMFGNVIVLLSFMGVFYNLKPIRAKEKPISIPWQAVSRGLFFFPMVWAAYGDIMEPVPWILGGFMFWYVLGFQNSADIIDKEVDEQYGVSTFVVMFGVRNTAIIAGGAMLMMWSTIMLGMEYGYLAERFSWMITIIPFCIGMIYYMVFHPEKVSGITGNHPSYLLYYAGMVLAVAIPLSVEIFN